MAAAVHKEKLPDGVDPEEAIKQLWLALPVEGVNRRGPLTISLRDALAVLRDHDSATISTLSQEAFKGEWLDSAGWTASQWRDKLIDPYFARIPGVERDGRTWSYTPGSARRPSVPDDPEHPSTDEEAALLDDLDIPGDHGGGQRNRVGVRDAYRHLCEHGTATREDLVTAFTPSSVYQPTYERYDDRHEWWVRIGAPMLTRLPGVDAPPMPAGEWRFIGLGGDD